MFSVFLSRISFSFRHSVNDNDVNDLSGPRPSPARNQANSIRAGIVQVDRPAIRIHVDASISSR